MKVKGADEVVRALEDEGVRFTFGIPGTHNIELYDALERSQKVSPVLVTDEQSASFMADAVSRATGGVGVANVVPGAGVTHTLSGVGEAFMDNIALVVLTCGIRLDTGKAFQLHDVDQLAILRPITKAQLRPERPDEIYATMRRAFQIARSGTPGPVVVEIPANLYFLTHDVENVRQPPAEPAPPAPTDADIAAALALLQKARSPLLYVGHGARNAAPLVKELAERLGMPVATTVQGKGVFSEKHPLWLWCGYGPMAPPFARTIVERSDATLAIGCRFGEIATGSYGAKPPGDLIHVDISPEVLNRNFEAKLAIAADARRFLEALLAKLPATKRDAKLLEAEIAQGHAAVVRAWHDEPSADRVSPYALFEALQKHARPRSIYVTDSGNGTFLGMEHLRLEEAGLFLGPIDYSCMGYSVPAAIGAKLACPDRDVVCLAGDGALLMTGLEMITAASYGIAPVFGVLRDGELGQIAQFQRTTLKRDTLSVLPPYELESLAKACGCEYVALSSDKELDASIAKAFDLTRRGKPAVLEIAIDYSRRTYFTKGVVATNFWRLPLAERVRKVARVAGRAIAGALGSAPPTPKEMLDRGAPAKA